MSVTTDALSQDASALRLTQRDTYDMNLPYSVPVPARPLLRAARAFQDLRGGTRGVPRLFSAGLSRQLHDAAYACQVRLPFTPITGTSGPWHGLTRCWWIADPLHGNNYAL